MFVGIYWERYGWIAPGEEISGLEDEYRLADPQMPKLIYLKASAAREERLAALIKRIQRDDTASYVTFHTEDELRDHLVRDLATLLAERFTAAADARRRRHQIPRTARCSSRCRRRTRRSWAARPRSTTWSRW